MANSLKEAYLQSIRLGEVNDSLADLLDDVDKLSKIQVNDGGVEYSKKDAEMVERAYHDRCLKQIQEVHKLGKQIGYGAMMSWASALWRYSLIHEYGLDPSGAFVPRCVDVLSEQEKVYDRWIDKYMSNRDSSSVFSSTNYSASHQDVIAVHAVLDEDVTALYAAASSYGFEWTGVQLTEAYKLVNDDSVGRVYVTIHKSIKTVVCTRQRPNLDPYIYETYELGYGLKDAFLYGGSGE